MAGEWAKSEARKLCGCHECSGFGTPEERCERDAIAKGVRAGLAHAASIARSNDACAMCGAVHVPTVPLCEGPCINSYDETEDGRPVATADLIERLLTPTKETTHGR